MKRAAGILALVLVVSLLGSSDVRGFALQPAGKTTGPALTATIVIDVGGSGADTKGLTSIRVQKASSSAAVLFTSGYVRLIGFDLNCLAPSETNLQSSTNDKFTGLINGFIDTPSVLASLLTNFGTPNKAAITNIDYPVCTTVNYIDAGGGVLAVRQTLSFMAVIQFQP